MPDVTSPFAFPYPEDTDLVRDGAQDIENLAIGVNDYLTGGYLYTGQVRFTSSGSFVKADYPGLRAIRVRVVGGGGGGGGGDGTSPRGGGGGGGGGYAEAFITDIASLDASVTVTRGAGGAGGADTGLASTAGTNGDTSSFGALVVATGGLGASNDGASGGAGTAGDYLVGGGGGGSGGFDVNLMTGTGGSSVLGGGGVGLSPFPGNTGGATGRQFGGGGGGARRFNAGRAGGAGQNGIVICDLFV
jgi:hypothetical protein